MRIMITIYNYDDIPILCRLEATIRSSSAHYEDEEEEGSHGSGESDKEEDEDELRLQLKALRDHALVLQQKGR
jgi:hypothetical protein